MNYFLAGALTVAIFSFGCSKRTEVAISDSLQPQNEVTTPIAPQTKETPDQARDGHDPAMLQSFLNSEMIYQDGQVVVKGGDEDSRRLAALAQSIFDNEGYTIRDGAKILLVEEADFNRLIWQELLEDGTNVGETTVLLEKGTNERLLGVTGFYSGPLP